MLQSEDIDEIETMVAALRDAPRLTEIELRSGERSLFLRRPASAASSGNAPPAPAKGNRAASEPVENKNAPVPAAGGDNATEPEPAPTYATAHLVGIFRAGRKPVSPGETVQEAQVLGHIEAMRLMNDCLSPASGRIVAALVRDGQPVEYGQPLFEIAPE